MQTLSAELVLDRMVRAVENVRQRLLRATAALNSTGLPYAVTGGNAAACWVASVDQSAVRNTQDVDILIRRPDLPAVRTALEHVGFVHLCTDAKVLFLDGPDAKERDAVRLWFATEQIHSEREEISPMLEACDAARPYRVLDLPPLVQWLLSSWRRTDRVDVRDLIDVGLVDTSWLTRLPPELSERLQTILATPEG